MAQLFVPIQNLASVLNEGKTILSAFAIGCFRVETIINLVLSPSQQVKERMPESEWSASGVVCI